MVKRRDELPVAHMQKRKPAPAAKRPDRPEIPRFDPAKDGNPFFWIVSTANKLRE